MWFYLYVSYTLYHVHLPSPLGVSIISKNRMFIPLFLSGKNVIFQISNFYLKKLSNKKTHFFS